jgi:ABC-type oligopeptide transport system ATPase subunit
MALLEVDSLTKHFAAITAVDDASFEVREGEILGLAGPNGAGKTVTFNCITGQLQPDAGTVVFDGENIPLTGLHYHDRQEEAFYVLDGRISVETPDREYVVDRGEVFVAEPESPHRAFNGADASGDATVLAVGAPPVSDGHPYEP